MFSLMYVYVVSAQGLPGPHGDIGAEGPQGKQVCPFLTTFTYLIVNICCDLYISFYELSLNKRLELYLGW